MEQQFDAGKIGMWLFLVTEILLFGGLFVGFGIMQSMHREAFLAAHHHLDRTLGAINTIVLLLSQLHHGDGGRQRAAEPSGRR